MTSYMPSKCCLLLALPTLGIIIHINYASALGFQKHGVAGSPAASLSSPVRPSFSLPCPSAPRSPRMGQALGQPPGCLWVHRSAFPPSPGTVPSWWLEVRAESGPSSLSLLVIRINKVLFLPSSFFFFFQELWVLWHNNRCRIKNRWSC